MIMQNEDIKLLIRFAYAIIDLVAENSNLKEEVNALREYREKEEEYNNQMLHQQQQNIGSLLRTLLNKTENNLEID